MASPTKPIRLAKDWSGRNSDVTRAAWSYLVLAGDALSQQQGAAAAKKFNDERKAEFGAAAKQSLHILFKGGVVAVPACQNLVAAVDRGAMDIRNMSQHYKTLQEIDVDLQGLQEK